MASLRTKRGISFTPVLLFHLIQSISIVDNCPCIDFVGLYLLNATRHTEAVNLDEAAELTVDQIHVCAIDLLEIVGI